LKFHEVPHEPGAAIILRSRSRYDAVTLQDALSEMLPIIYESRVHYLTQKFMRIAMAVHIRHGRVKILYNKKKLLIRQWTKNSAKFAFKTALNTVLKVRTL
jgi:hypothetical protein